MLLVLWRTLVVQVSKLLELADTTSAKFEAFTTTMTTLRLVVIGNRFQPQQLLVCFTAPSQLFLFHIEDTFLVEI